MIQLTKRSKNIQSCSQTGLKLPRFGMTNCVCALLHNMNAIHSLKSPIIYMLALITRVCVCYVCVRHYQVFYPIWDSRVDAAV